MTFPDLFLPPFALVPPAQLQGQIVDGVIFAALAGAAIFAICRSSRRG